MLPACHNIKSIKPIKYQTQTKCDQRKEERKEVTLTSSSTMLGILILATLPLEMRRTRKMLSAVVWSREGGRWWAETNGRGGLRGRRNGPAFVV